MDIYIILFFIALLAIAATQVIIIILMHKKRSCSTFIRRKNSVSGCDFPFHQLSDKRLAISPRGMFIIAMSHIREADLNDDEAAEYINTFFSIYMKRNNLHIVYDDERWALLFEEKDFIKWDDSIKPED